MPTLAQYPNATTAAQPGGQVVLGVLFETYTGSGTAVAATGVTITITAASTPDGGTGTPVPATSTGVVQQSPGQYQFVWTVPPATVPGSYLATWTGTRTNDGVQVEYTQAVIVASTPAPVPVPGVYATVAQYQAWSGDTYTPAAMVTTKLARASEQLDVALVAAVYRTDADGMPTDPALIAVLVRACSAQAQYLLAHNDDAGVKREYSSTNVGGVSTTRAVSMQALALPPIAPQALAILRVAGVLPAAPLVNW
jgi:hypothetical protein